MQTKGIGMMVSGRAEGGWSLSLGVGGYFAVDIYERIRDEAHCIMTHHKPVDV